MKQAWSEASEASQKPNKLKLEPLEVHTLDAFIGRLRLNQVRSATIRDFTSQVTTLPQYVDLETLLSGEDTPPDIRVTVRLEEGSIKTLDSTVLKASSAVKHNYGGALSFWETVSEPEEKPKGAFRLERVTACNMNDMEKTNDMQPIPEEEYESDEEREETSNGWARACRR